MSSIISASQSGAENGATTPSLLASVSQLFAGHTPGPRLVQADAPADPLRPNRAPVVLMHCEARMWTPARVVNRVYMTTYSARWVRSRRMSLATDTTDPNLVKQYFRRAIAVGAKWAGNLFKKQTTRGVYKIFVAHYGPLPKTLDRRKVLTVDTLAEALQYMSLHPGKEAGISFEMV